MKENRGLWCGKRVDNGVWVKGFLVKMWGEVHLQDRENENLMIQVDPETLGECTGLVDKNGKLAFEGDLVKNEFNAIGVIRYGEYKQPFNDDEFTKHIGFYIDWLEESSEAYLRVDLGYWLPLAEIIGNIHDNPELLKKGD